MPNVLFKRGLQNALDSVAIQDGVFYLTTDTNRLYADINNKRELLNQTVQIVSSLSELEARSNAWTTTATKSAHVNDFYYIQGKNILAVWTYDEDKETYQWSQINPDTNTTVESVELKGSATNNEGTITLKLTDSEGTTKTNSMTITGSNGIYITSTSDNLAISGRTYTLGKELSGDSKIATIQLDSSDTSVSATYAKFEAGTNVSFANNATNDSIVISAQDTTIQSVSLTSTTAGQLTIAITDDQGTTKTNSLSNLGVKLNDNSFVLLTGGNSGTAGSIYSKTEIDNMLNGLNGMNFKGTVGSTGATVTALPSANVSVGDVYVAVGNVSTSGVNFVSPTGDAAAAGTRTGDMFVATGTETDGVITSGLAWVYIPAGNDSSDAYTYSSVITTATNTLRIENLENNAVAVLNLTAGTDMAISSAAGKDLIGDPDNSKMTTTISHATITSTTSAPATLSNKAASFSGVKSLTLSNGHVTNVEYDTFTPVIYELDEINVTTTVTATTASPASAARASFSVKDDAGSSQLTPANLTISSSSIAVSAGSTTGTFQMDLVWGEF